MAIKVWLHGYKGRMGQEIIKEISESDAFSLAGASSRQGIAIDGKEHCAEEETIFLNGLKKAELIIDFSSIEGNHSLFTLLSKTCNLPVVIGTTGLDSGTLKNWKDLAQSQGHRILFAPNTSLGILLTMKLGCQLARVLSPRSFDIELLESHHRHKADSPSGTAKFLAESIAKSVPLKPTYQRQGKRQEDELGVFALRGGSVFGEHEIRFMGDLEELSISHRALSRKVFSRGALLMGQWIYGKKEKGHYGLSDINIDEITISHS